MMNAKIRAVALAAVGTSMLSACATKGFVRNAVQEERMARIEADSTIRRDVARDVDAIRADLASVRTDVQSLRADLQGLRTEFGAKITALEEGMRFAFPVTFAFDDATVREADRAALDRFAQVVQKYYTNSTITVEGFADPAGSARYNQTLSKRRADAVAAYLVERGLASTNLRAVGYGESRQVNRWAVKDDPGAEANRRVVFVVESRGDNTVAVIPQSER